MANKEKVGRKHGINVWYIATAMSRPGMLAQATPAYSTQALEDARL